MTGHIFAPYSPHLITGCDISAHPSPLLLLRSGPATLQAERLIALFIIVNNIYAAALWTQGSILTFALISSFRNSSCITSCTY